MYLVKWQIKAFSSCAISYCQPVLALLVLLSIFLFPCPLCVGKCSEISSYNSQIRMLQWNTGRKVQFAKSRQRCKPSLLTSACPGCAVCLTLIYCMRTRAHLMKKLLTKKLIMKMMILAKIKFKGHMSLRQNLRTLTMAIFSPLLSLKSTFLFNPRDYYLFCPEYLKIPGGVLSSKLRKFVLLYSFFTMELTVFIALNSYLSMA